MNLDLQKANDLIKKGNFKLSSWSVNDCINSYEKKKNDAINYYLQAVELYKMLNKWENAGDAYVKASYTCDDKYKSGCYVEQAAICYKKANIDNKKYYENAAKIFIEIRKFNLAAQCYEEMKEYENAIKYYKMAECESRAFELTTKMLKTNIRIKIEK